MTTLNSAHALLLSTIQNSPIAVLKRAVDALESGPTSFAITRQLPGEIRALVSLNGGVEYGVTLTDSVSTCSCKSALYRGGICKHMTALCLHVLRDPQPKAEAPVPQFPTFHLAWSDGSPLCGDPEPARVQARFTQGMLTWREACSACRSAYNHESAPF
jgi:hypothetical protein